MSRYPKAEWVPWRYPEPGTNRPTYYRGQNTPIAVVLHIQQGWASTARQWARQGKFPKSWHFTVARDGSIMQHMDFEDGGYHAGITAYKAAHYPPTWPLWKGPNINVNNYTIGIEHEGFYDQIYTSTGSPLTPKQREASHQLCHWLSDTLSIPYDEEHFPPHAVIDLRDRPNDFAVPAARKLHYDFLFERSPDPMIDEEARAAAETAQARNEILNDIIVMKRDIDRAVNGQHPALYEIHKMLVESGHLGQPEYRGDYRGYA